MSTEGNRENKDTAHPETVDPNAAQAAINAAVMTLVKGAKITTDVDAIAFNKDELQVVKRVKVTNVGTDNALIKAEIYPKSANALSLWHVIEANKSVNLKFDRQIFSPNVNDFTCYIWYVATESTGLDGAAAKAAWEAIAFPHNVENAMPAKVVKIFIAN